MNFFPIENIDLITNLTEKQIIEKFHKNVNPTTAIRSGYWGERNTKIYEGEIGRNNFEITKIVNYQRLFPVYYLPMIKGTIIADGNQTKIKIEMRLNMQTYILVSILCVLILAILFSLLIIYFFLFSFRPIYLLPLGLLSSMYLFILFVFNSECRKSKSNLETIFEAKVI